MNFSNASECWPAVAARSTAFAAVVHRHGQLVLRRHGVGEAATGDVAAMIIGLASRVAAAMRAEMN
jgi:hypothetical protein